MSREILLWMLSLVLVGGLNVACGAWLPGGLEPAGLPRLASAREAERKAWRSLWAPLVPGMLVLAFLLGWALQEPERAEALHAWAYLVATPFALLWARAAIRAWRSGSARQVPVAGTVGLLWPRVVMSPDLRAAVDEHAYRAAVEHENAHVRHRDPLRLWGAQVATDLQWPAARARRRLAQWREVLELARDEEACERGVPGPDLAAAVLAAARIHPAPVTGAVVRLGERPADGNEPLRVRVGRLLGEPSARDLATPRGSPLARGVLAHLGGLVAVAALLIATLGYLYGEAVVSRIVDL